MDVFDSTFKPASLAGNLRDPNLPAGYAPFGIANINGNLFVTFALQDQFKHDDVAALAMGLSTFSTLNGNWIERFASRGKLNSPWGIPAAPYNFGRFSTDLLAGYFGDGRINAFKSGG